MKLLTKELEDKLRANHRANKKIYGTNKKPTYSYGNMDENTKNVLKLIRSGAFTKET